MQAMLCPVQAVQIELGLTRRPLLCLHRAVLKKLFISQTGFMEHARRPELVLHRTIQAEDDRFAMFASIDLAGTDREDLGFDPSNEVSFYLKVLDMVEQEGTHIPARLRPPGWRRRKGHDGVLQALARNVKQGENGTVAVSGEVSSRCSAAPFTAVE